MSRTQRHPRTPGTICAFSAITAPNYSALPGNTAALVPLHDQATRPPTFSWGTVRRHDSRQQPSAVDRRDPAPWPHVRILTDHDGGTLAPLAYAHGPPSGEKAAGEQHLLGEAAPALLPAPVAPAPPADTVAPVESLHAGHRAFPGGQRLAELVGQGLNLLVRLPVRITVARTGDHRPDGPFLADVGLEPIAARLARPRVGRARQRRPHR